MSNQWQARRGTTAQNDAFTGASGEITYDTDSQGLRIHDGTKQGGYLIDTVVDFQKPTAENNYTWYRLYASGFVEQGGSVFISAGTAGLNTLINLPVAMADTRYTATIGLGDKSANNTSVFCWICIKTTTNIALCTSLIDPTVVDTGWQVSGMAA